MSWRRDRKKQPLNNFQHHRVNKSQKRFDNNSSDIGNSYTSDFKDKESNTNNLQNCLQKNLRPLIFHFFYLFIFYLVLFVCGKDQKLLTEARPRQRIENRSEHDSNPSRVPEESKKESKNGTHRSTKRFKGSNVSTKTV